MLGGDGGDANGEGTECEKVTFDKGQGTGGGGSRLNGAGDRGGQTGGGGGDRVDGEGGCEEGGGGGDAALGKNAAEFFESPVGAHAGGIAIDAEFAGDFGMSFVLVKSKKNKSAFAFRKLVNGAIDFRRELVPRFGRGLHGFEICGGLFAFLAADFGSDVIDRSTMGFAVKPSGEREGIWDSGGFFNEAKKDNLNNVTGVFGISGDPASHGVNEGKVSVHERRQRRPRRVAQVLFDKLVVAV